MARKYDIRKPLEARKLHGGNQQCFWSKFGGTQSGGSRYESGRKIPIPTALLMQLYFDGKITDDDLAAAAKVVARR